MLKIRLRKIEHKYCGSYNDVNHIYKVKNPVTGIINEVPSISSLNNVSYFFYDFWNKTTDEIIKIQESIKFAQIRGNEIHKFLEDIIKDWSQNGISNNITVKHRNLFTYETWFKQAIAILNFLLKQNWTIIACEEFVITPYFCGRIDLVVLDEQDNIIIVDFKSNLLFSDQLNKIQLVGYAFGMKMDWIGFKNRTIKIAILHSSKDLNNKINVTYSEIRYSDSDVDYFQSNISYYNNGKKHQSKLKEIIEERDKKWNI